MLREDYGGQILDALRDCYRAGADGKSRPFEGDFETELEAFSCSSGVSMERLRANRFMETMYKLANETYDIGAIDRAREDHHSSI